MKAIYNTTQNIYDTNVSLHSINQFTNMPLKPVYDYSGKAEWSKTEQQLNNPQVTFFEERIAALEGSVGAIALKSLNAARYLLIKNLVKVGDNIVSFNSQALLHNKYKRLGIDIRLSENGELNTFKNLVNANTKLIYLETVSNEFSNVPDFQKIISFAKEKDIPVLVDNTYGAAGYISKPIAEGANIVIESTSSWLRKGKEYIGAVIIDGGNYNWRNGKFSQFDSPYLKYYDLRLKRYIPESEINFSLISHLRKKGNINENKFTIPLNPFELVEELNNIPKIIQHQSNIALKLAEWLQEHAWVKSVKYVGLKNNPNHFRALTYFKNTFGNELSFTIRGSADNFEKFQSGFPIDSKLVSIKFNEENYTIKLRVNSGSIELIKELLKRSFQRIEQIPTQQVEFNQLNSLYAIF